MSTALRYIGPAGTKVVSGDYTWSEPGDEQKVDDETAAYLLSAPDADENWEKVGEAKPKPDVPSQSSTVPPRVGDEIGSS